MNRREFLKLLSLGVIGIGFPSEVLAIKSGPRRNDDYVKDYLYSPLKTKKRGYVTNTWDHMLKAEDADPAHKNEFIDINDYMQKMRNYDSPDKDDIFVSQADYKTFNSTFMRIDRVKNIVGDGHFHLLSFDDALKTANNHSEAGSFSKDELDFMETIFYKEASLYGFFGQKPIDNITEKIKSKEVIKVPYTGNYIYQGVPLEMYKKIKQQVGEQVTLTSGVRGIMKQFYLFFNKAYRNGGNLSLASRSLAPPGYSFHGNGDFDVGQVGFGAYNFSERFTTTKVFRMLYDLGYLKLRYPEKNYLGVRFEPWHIKTNQI